MNTVQLVDDSIKINDKFFIIVMVQLGMQEKASLIKEFTLMGHNDVSALIKEADTNNDPIPIKKSLLETRGFIDKRRAEMEMKLGKRDFEITITDYDPR